MGHSRAGWLWRVTPEATTEETDAQTDTQTDAAQPGVEVLTATGSSAPRGTETARARIIEDGATIAIAASNPNGSIEVTLPAGSDNRQLVLAERANPGFRAYLDGQELAATVTEPDWVQAFDLPATGGTLTLSYDPPAGTWLWAIPAVAGVLIALLGIPTPVRARPRKNT